MYSGTKIEMYNGGTFTEQPFTDEQRVQRMHWKESAYSSWFYRSSMSLGVFMVLLKVPIQSFEFNMNKNHGIYV